MPEPPSLLVEQSLEGRQDDPWTRRVCTDGSVWTRTSIRSWVEGGRVHQDRQPLEWRRTTRLGPEAVDRIRAVIRDQGVLDLPAEHRPSRTTMGRGEVVWRVALDGREHEVRLLGVDPAEVAPLAALGQTVELAVAMALDAESEAPT